MNMTRAQREKHASDETQVYRHWHRLRERFSHIFESPNSQRAYHFLSDLLKQEVSGRRILKSAVVEGNLLNVSHLLAQHMYMLSISQSYGLSKPRRVKCQASSNMRLRMPHNHYPVASM